MALSESHQNSIGTAASRRPASGGDGTGCSGLDWPLVPSMSAGRTPAHAPAADARPGGAWRLLVIQLAVAAPSRLPRAMTPARLRGRPPPCPRSPLRPPMMRRHRMLARGVGCGDIGQRPPAHAPKLQRRQPIGPPGVRFFMFLSGDSDMAHSGICAIVRLKHLNLVADGASEVAKVGPCGGAR